MREVAIAAALFLPLLACSSSTPPVTRYLLRGDLVPGSGRVDAPARVVLARLVVAPYLSGAEGIVIETAPGQVQAANQHQWAEPIEAGIRSFLSAEIGAALGYPLSASYLDRPAWDQRVDVSIDRLHGTMDGTAVLEARYRITSGGDSGEGVEFRFASSTALPREGYSGVVEAEASLLRELGRAIAGSLARDAGRT